MNEYVVETGTDHFTLVRGARSLTEAREAVGRPLGTLAVDARYFSGTINKTKVIR